MSRRAWMRITALMVVHGSLGIGSAAMALGHGPNQSSLACLVQPVPGLRRQLVLHSGLFSPSAGTSMGARGSCPGRNDSPASPTRSFLALPPAFTSILRGYEQAARLSGRARCGSPILVATPLS